MDGQQEEFCPEGQAAHRAIKSYFSKLVIAIMRESIPDTLYSIGVLGDEAMDTLLDRTQTDKQKGRIFVREVQNAVHIDPKCFFKFCDILTEEKLSKDLSQDLRSKYDEYLKEEKAKSESNQDREGLSGEFQLLMSDLDVFGRQLTRGVSSNSDNIFQCIKDSIHHAIDSVLKAGEEVETVREQMWSLCYKHFKVPTDLCKWALNEVDAVNKALLPSEPSAPVEPIAPTAPSKDQPSLFSKDTLHHAGLCCQAVSTCNAGTFMKFFDNQVTNHLLQEVSMSISSEKKNVDRYIIAKQGNVIYVAFESEPTLSQWMDSMYTSFEDGLHQQMNRIPLKFFVEQLGDQKRIVFTGFSFGGMLACCVAANLWEETYVSIDTLQKNVICITYGQPMINIPFVQEAIRHFPQLRNTIHLIYDKEDTFPLVFRYFNIGCIHYKGTGVPVKGVKALTAGKSTVSEPPLVKEAFQALFPKKFLGSLSTLHEQLYSNSVTSQPHVQSIEFALSSLKETLREVIPHEDVERNVLLGEHYLISSEEHQGLVWNKITKAIGAQALGALTVAAAEKLEISAFKKHSAIEYRHKIFRSHLEKQPKYEIPGPSKDVREISSLKPDVKAVELHKYHSEVVITLEGENLWFCHAVRLGDTEITIPETLSRRSLTFNLYASEKTEKLMKRNASVKITLLSHFANPIRRNIKVDQEPHNYSLRQIQLAKHTPTEVIQLAFWSALLEQYSPRAAKHDQEAPSQRMAAVIHFLEEAVKVVPIESILFAISHSDYDAGVKCAEALLACRQQLPRSVMMTTGALTAIARMRTGLHGSDIDKYTDLAMKKLAAYSGCTTGLSTIEAVSSDKLRFGFIPALEYVTHLKCPVPMPVHSYAEAAARRNVPHSSRQPWSAPIARMADLNLEIVVPFLSPQSHNMDIDLKPDPSRVTNPCIADRLDEYLLKTTKGPVVPNRFICDHNIEHLYPVSTHRRHTLYAVILQSPLEVLRSAREKIASFLKDSQEDLDSSAQSTQSSNEQMLALVREIKEDNLRICAALLGAFMEQQIRIPLIKTEDLDTANLLSEKSSPVAMGVWALFSVSYEELVAKLNLLKGNPLFVEIAGYISGVLSDDFKKPSKKTSNYNGKLQFLLQGIKKKKTVSCSGQYISYSLEHQLCQNLKFEKSTSVKTLIRDWDEIFKEDALSLVARSHRPLIARWLKWAVLIHDLREALAKYTCIGVIGLVNSGKSQLVSKLFGVEAAVGTTERKRTTVPLLYNLDGKVDGLDIIDFPGVDDEDHSIPELAQLLLGLVQVVVLVVEYGRISTKPAKKLLESLLKEETVPVLVCLTHVDRLYVEHIDKDVDNNCTPLPTEFKKRVIGHELMCKEDDIGYHHSCKIGFYCFNLPADSRALFSMEDLKKVGIGSLQDVGDQLVDIFRNKLKLTDIASRLDQFVHPV